MLMIFNSSSVSNPALNSINEDLNNIYEITTKNGLKINAAKTNSILFGSSKRRNEINKEIVLKINDEKIIVTENVKNLGLILDNRLSYTKHVTNLC